ncbi:ATP-binding protein [Actinacidiphila guanduensis]|uniref:histidine kinase n=1 Tax=Actinacidiphila guanduensis TaxID=310781 RepID=A0A1G9ZRJ0_9ACTN|nr:ATP-binding protein [Actinacidiphila guanduensis]SDN23810.1 Signal transduction histidine kinase [Actinacidiphila guanduensis]
MLGCLVGCAAILLAAAAPGVVLAADDLSAAQDRVGAADLATKATALAHSLADERDDLAAAEAAGHPALTAGDKDRTDQQAQDLAAGAHGDLHTALAGLPAARRAALAAKDPQGVVNAYQPLADALGRAVEPVTATLARATAAAALQRGLLVAALTGHGGQSGPVAAAQTARLQERAALAEFRGTAPAALRSRWDQTVTGADTDEADHDLDRLLDGPELTSHDRDLSTSKVKSALTTRIGLMRGVEASAAADEAKAARAHRDHVVTVLELRCALALLCLLLLVGVLATLFRGLTRPLAALHRWSRSDPESGEGARVVGADEFAVIARRINALTQEAQALRGRAKELTQARTAAAAAHAALAAEHRAALQANTELQRTRDDLMRSREEIAGQLTDATARNAVQVAYVNLSLRTLGLIERQLAVIEGMEEREQEPERLDLLFRLDHLATRMRRNSENLLVLAGTEHSHGATASPIALVDVARAAISEVERYERVRIQSVPEAQVAGRAADDIGHLIAELLDNAAAFSAPGSDIHLSGWVMPGGGEVMLTVEDSGIGIPPDRMAELNALLADPDPPAPGTVVGLGLYVVARLAHRHGIRVQLRPQEAGGTTAVVVLPQLLLPSIDPHSAVVPPRHEAPPRRDPNGFTQEPGGFTAEPAVSAQQSEALGAERFGLAAGEGAFGTGGAELTAESGAYGSEGAGFATQGGGFGPDGTGVGAQGGGFGSEQAGADTQGGGFGSDGAGLPAESGSFGTEGAGLAAEAGPFAPSPAPLPPEARPLAPEPARFGAQAEPFTAEAPPAPVVPSQARPVVPQPLPPEHARADQQPVRAEVPPQGGPAAREAAAGPALPKRTRAAGGVRSVRPAAERAQRSAPLDAEKLRRKLAGLQQGLRDGRRDAELETPGRTPPGSIEEATR